MFQDLEPWRTIIRREQLNEVDHDAVITESLMRVTNRNADAFDLDENTVTAEAFPQIECVVQEAILPRMIDYLSDVWQLEHPQWSHNAWVRVTTGGEGMKLHGHTGCQLSAIYYPMANDGGQINLVDPRGCADRGYPTVVRSRHFNLFSESPSEGLLLIFPSYLSHYVDGHDKSMRVSIPVDLYIQHPK